MSIKFIKNDDTYDVGSCPISTVRLDGFSAEKIVNIIDYSDDIYENSIFYHETVELNAVYPTGDITQAVSGFPVQYYETLDEYEIDSLVTDRINSRSNPLYYSYELKFDVFSPADNEIVEIYKNNDQVVDPKDYEIEYGNITLSENFYGDQDPDLDRYGSGIVWGDFDNTTNTHRLRVLLPIDVNRPTDYYTIRYNKSLYNLTFPTHSELIELEKVYDERDYYTESGVIKRTELSRIPENNITSLFMIKDTNRQIKQNGILSLNATNLQTSEETSWNIRINNGNFMTHGDLNNSGSLFFKTDYVSSTNADADKHQVVTFIKPNILGSNVIKVNEAPIFVSGYMYPDYEIDIFPKESFDTIIPTGTFGFDIEGFNVDDLKISSIDRERGFILLNKHIPADKEIDMFFYVDGNTQTYIRNLELNPRLQGADFGFANDAINTFKNIGIAVRHSPEEGLEGITALAPYCRPYFFDFDNIGTFYRANQAPGIPTVSEEGELRFNPYSNEISSSGEFIPIAHLSLNRLSPEILKINDARVIGGGLIPESMKRLHNTESNSFSEVGYYDGEPLPHAGLVVIHIPSGIYPALINEWEESDLFNSDLYTDITKEEIEQLLASTNDPIYIDYYNKLLQGFTSSNDQNRDTFGVMQRAWATREASHYLDQLVKKYIPAGTQYILLDEEFNHIKLDL